MPHKIHKKKPSRTCSKKYADYKSYKRFIVVDFNNRCGYCDCHDRFLGGKKNFQIDHFRPHSIAKFQQLKHVYSNLVYACQSCNGAKSNKWKNEKGFVDPCDHLYDTLIFRNNDGSISHNGTPQGEYIYSNLRLYLDRHTLFWAIEKLDSQKEAIKSLINSGKNNNDALYKIFYIIQNAIDTHTSHLYKEISE